MMREILFRGKMENTQLWIEGDLRQYSSGNYAIKSNELPHLEYIHPETVGQYTGLTDKNGNRIFEGDVVRETFKNPRTYVVEFDDGRAGWYPFACGDGCGCCETNVICPEFSEVIGNIHDNPELIAKEEEYV